MQKILFVCHGNICRSPMAEMIMKDLIRKKGLEEKFYIQSAGNTDEDMGMPIYYLAVSKLKENNILVEDRLARRVIPEDYDTFDYLVTMEMMNIRDIKNIIPVDSKNKIARLLDYTDSPKDIADPWYTRDFETAFREIKIGCECFLDYLLTNE